MAFPAAATVSPPILIAKYYTTFMQLSGIVTVSLFQAEVLCVSLKSSTSALPVRKVEKHILRTQFVLLTQIFKYKNIKFMMLK